MSSMRIEDLNIIKIFNYVAYRMLRFVKSWCNIRLFLNLGRQHIHLSARLCASGQKLLLKSLKVKLPLGSGTSSFEISISSSMDKLFVDMILNFFLKFRLENTKRVKLSKFRNRLFFSTKAIFCISRFEILFCRLSFFSQNHP